MIILGTNSIKDTGFDVANSVRLNPPSNDYFNRTPSSASNRRTFTLSVWIKRWEFSSSDWVIRATGGGNATGFYFPTGSNNNKINFYSEGSSDINLVTAQVFRDPSAWYHIVFAVDTTQSTEQNRVKMYVNGSLATISGTYPSVNDDTAINEDVAHFIATDGASSSNRLGCYLSEFVLIDGQQLAADQFGKFDEDSGIWKPIDVSGLTFGTNGFYLDFEDSSALGNDAAGSNNFTANNLTAIDQSTDTCTNNFCTPNPLYPPRNGSVAFSEGNLKTVFTSYEQSPNGTIGAGAGKWYYEMKMSGTHARFGWCESHCPQGDLDSNDTFPAYAIYSNGSNGLAVYKNVTTRGISQNSGYTSFSAGDTVGIAFDIDNGKFYAHLNGTYYNSGDPANGTGAIITDITAQQGGLFLPYLNCGTNLSRTYEWNFGSPSYSISSGNTDGNSYGNFEYAVPSGYFALNTKNLAEYG